MPMKNLIIILIAIITNGNLFSQNPIIIDDPLHGGISIPFIDTIISSLYSDNGPCIDWPDQYFIDLDKDSINDISVYLECYMGGRGELVLFHMGIFKR